MKLLVVQGEVRTSPASAAQLGSAGFPVEVMRTTEEAEHALVKHQFAAIVVEADVPGPDAIAFIRNVRVRGDGTPILVVSSRTAIDDRVAALRVGADDVMTNPVAFEELGARIEALLRRPTTLLGTTLELANLTLDTDGRRCFVSNIPILLSAREIGVLEMLMRRSGRLVPKKFLEDQLFGLAADIASNAIEVYVHRIRKQLADAGAKAHIRTVRGIGYLISEGD